MIRLKDLDQDIIASVMSGLFYKETTKETYVYYNFLKSLLNTDEVIDEIYMVYSALDTLYDLFAIRRDVPVINKEIVLSIIKENLYGEVLLLTLATQQNALQHQAKDVRSETTG